MSALITILTHYCLNWVLKPPPTRSGQRSNWGYNHDQVDGRVLYLPVDKSMYGDVQSCMSPYMGNIWWLSATFGDTHQLCSVFHLGGPQ
jgi:hypothetical protein